VIYFNVTKVYCDQLIIFICSKSGSSLHLLIAVAMHCLKANMPGLCSTWLYSIAISRTAV